MVFVLSGQDRARHPAVFERLFRLRHRVFIVNREWSLPWNNGMEIDQYDTGEAYYFVDFDADGEILAHLRLTPTMRSSLIADYFPHLVENGVDPRGSTIYEGTRFMILPTQRNKSAYRSVKSRFMAAVTEWCIERQITHMQTVIDAGTLPAYVEVSLLATPLGLPHPFGGGKGVRGGGDCLAFRLPMTEALLEDIRMYGDISEPTRELWQPMPLELA